MIKYQLICQQAHEFEGWFSNSSAFDEQCAAGYVDCPICGTKDVRRALMAPNLNSPKNRQNPELPALPKAEEVAQAVSGSEAVANETPQTPPKDNPIDALSPSDQSAVVGAAMTILRDMHKKVKQDFTNVGAKFAEEAREMHYGEKDQKPIYGTTTQDERDALEDEGIIYHHLPDLPPEH